ncbi:MAG: hypothetical protein ABR920_05305 [Terriglobales bacterium]
MARSGWDFTGNWQLLFDSTILFASANEDCTDRPESLEILSAVETSR